MNIVRRLLPLSIDFGCRHQSFGVNTPCTLDIRQPNIVSVYSRFLTHPIYSLCISPHALTTFAQPGRLRVIEAILKLPSISSFDVVRFADNRRVCLDADDDVCDRFGGLPVKAIFFECADLVGFGVSLVG